MDSAGKKGQQHRRFFSQSGEATDDFCIGNNDMSAQNANEVDRADENIAACGANLKVDD